MSAEKGINRIGSILGIIAGVIIGGILGLLLIANHQTVKGIFALIFGFLIPYFIIRIITLGIIWIVKGFKE